MEYGPGDLFKTTREAAKDWGMYYNGASIVRKREMGSSIYEVRENGKLKGYSYSPAKMGSGHKSSFSQSPEGKETVATIHSHGNYDGKFIDENGSKQRAIDNAFSSADKAYNKKENRMGYLATPSGTLLEHNPQKDEIIVVSKELPSDPKDPNRQNKIKPTEQPFEKSFVSNIIDWAKYFFNR